jgi:peptide-methionine (S)-S-oxide reductase
MFVSVTSLMEIPGNLYIFVYATGFVQRGDQTEKATFAAGCFWGVEHEFRKVKGVAATRVGYMGGHSKTPAYQQVCTGLTGHAESVEVTFDPSAISYHDLLKLFWNLHDPTQRNRQGNDVGHQYRSAIFFHDERQKIVAEESIRKVLESGKYNAPVVTELLPSSVFWEAEDYHQQYVDKKKNPNKYKNSKK